MGISEWATLITIAATITGAIGWSITNLLIAPLLDRKVELAMAKVREEFVDKNVYEARRESLDVTLRDIKANDEERHDRIEERVKELSALIREVLHLHRKVGDNND